MGSSIATENITNTDMYQSQDLPDQYIQKPVRATSSVHARITKLPSAEDPDTPQELVAIIITCHEGSTYDNLFSSVPQKSGLGKVAVYSVNNAGMEVIHKKLRDGHYEHNLGDTVDTLFKELDSVESDSVVFNWECCSHWSSTSYTIGTKEQKQNFMDLVKLLLDKGFMTMFSDFSLKMLINEWDEENLGPNPFIKSGEFGDSFELKFNPAVLEECPSAQLKRLGQLCDKGSAQIHALGGTIVYTVDKAKSDTSKYQLEILTVATRVGSTPLPSQLCSLDGHKGAAGHVLLKYPSGGMMLTSCGHWIELAKLDVSLDSLLRVAQTEYGDSYTSQLKVELDSIADESSRKERVEYYARQYVQQSAPCKESTRYSKKSYT
eukprot:TRINITY_DN355_c4_g1_i1.p1 TRINITY_DN355_c4_g1~~TRINITY_DN355_c4_g1_i1.p1  ORF type:complete len:378 (-),score=81.66 TRINITY_DN355_c4_g1_i1:195-1328(-)